MSLEELIAQSADPELVRTMLSFLIPMAVIQLVLGILMYFTVYRPIKNSLLYESGYRILKIRRNKLLMFLCGALTFAPYWIIGFELDDLIWEYFTDPRKGVATTILLYCVAFTLLFLAMLLHKSYSGATMGQTFRLSLSMTCMSVYYGIIGLLGFIAVVVVLISVVAFGAGVSSMTQERKGANYCHRCRRPLSRCVCHYQ